MSLTEWKRVSTIFLAIVIFVGVPIALFINYIYKDIWYPIVLKSQELEQRENPDMGQIQAYLRTNPHSFNAQVGLGIAYLKERRAAHAKSAFERAEHNLYDHRNKDQITSREIATYYYYYAETLDQMNMKTRSTQYWTLLSNLPEQPNETRINGFILEAKEILRSRSR